MRYAAHCFVGLITVLVLGCAGGTKSGDTGGGTGVLPDPGPAPAGSIFVSGTVNYERYLPQQFGGLNYTSPAEMPVRGATIRIRNSGGTITDQGVLDASGQFSGLAAPESEAYTIEVVAQLGGPTAPNTMVRDDFGGGAVYVGTTNAPASAVNVIHDILIPGGWLGASYAVDGRSAAPFAILDTVYEAQQFILASQPGLVFADLDVFWSEFTSMSAYGDGQFWLFGLEGVDTDEYDEAIVAHEWIHYFDDKHSRGDSLGGGHGALDYLDDTVAFSEGLATALGCLIIDDQRYIDTGGTAQGTTWNFKDLELDGVPDTQIGINGRIQDGYWSEDSVMEILYDFIDGPAGDDDPIALGPDPIIEAMVGGQATTPYFTSLYTFLFHLKALPSVTVDADIDAIAAAENVYLGNEYDPTDPSTPVGYRRYNDLSDDSTVVTMDMDGNNLESSTAYGTYNKLFNRIYFKGTASVAGDHTIKAWPSTATRVMYVRRPGDDGFTLVNSPYEWTVNLAAGEELVFQIGWDNGNAGEDFDIGWFPPGAMIPKVSN